MLSSVAEAIAVLAIISIVFHLVGFYLDIAHTHLTLKQVSKNVPDLTAPNYKVCIEPR